LKLRKGFVAVVIGAGLTVGLASPAFASSGTPNVCTDSHNSNTGNGANTSGQYDSTCVPLPSGNGNGNGNAVGKPMAGTVGNADDKNPPGQFPNGSVDANNGYECDGNHGIARTNPAHTSCQEPCPCPCGA
jgi:hypothetical protein